MTNNGYLDIKIEILRDKLCQYLLYLEPTDSKVVNLSQELDKYIVLYEKSRFFAKDSA